MFKHKQKGYEGLEGQAASRYVRVADASVRKVSFPAQGMRSAGRKPLLGLQHIPGLGLSGRQSSIPLLWRRGPWAFPDRYQVISWAFFPG